MKINFIDILVDTYNENVKKDIKYVHNKKYNTEDYFTEIIKFIRNSVYWRRHNDKINGRTLNNKHNEFIKYDIYKKAYSKILNLYLSENYSGKLKYQSTDTLFVKNKLCTGKLGRNKFYKNKKGIKVSSIVDSYGIPISIICKAGQMYDSEIFKKTYPLILINTNTIKYSKSNKHKQYLLADKGYDSLRVGKYNFVIFSLQRK